MATPLSAVAQSCYRVARFVTVIVAITSFLSSTATQAATLPIAKGVTYLLPVGEHDLRQALLDFGRATGVAVNIAAEIAGPVTGNGQLQPVADFVSALTSRSGLSWFSFRDTIYFSRSQDSVEASISVKASYQQSLRTALLARKLLDDRFSWTELPAQDQVLIYGPRAYVQLVRQQTSRLQAAAMPVSPKLPAEMPEAMIFKLKYAWAVDKSVGSNGSMDTRPGVASVLNALYKTSDRSPVATRQTGPQIVAANNRALVSQPTNASNSNAERPALRGLPTVPAIAAVPNMEVSQEGLPGTLRVQPVTQIAMADSTEPIGIAPPGYGVPQEPSGNRLLPRTDPFPVIEADQRTNSILIRDLPSRRAEYERLISSLDVPTQQLELETILIDMQEDDIAKSLGKLPSRGIVNSGIQQGLIVLSRETASALLAYAKAIGRRDRSGRSDLTVLSQTVVFKQDESFNLDFGDDHVYPELTNPLWKRIAAEVVTTATQPEPRVRSTAIKISGTANFSDGKIELQAAIEESRNRPDLLTKATDRRHTNLQMSVGLAEGDVCVLSNTSYLTGSDMNDSRGRIVLLSARRHGNRTE